MKKVITIISLAIIAVIVVVGYLLWEPVFLGTTSHTIITDAGNFDVIRQPHGVFYFLQSLPVTSTATRMALPFDTNASVLGLTHATSGSTSSTITFDYAGTYKITVKIIIDSNFGGGGYTSSFWFAKNGVDIPNSNILGTTASLSYNSFSFSTIVDANDNDTITAYMNGGSTGEKIFYSGSVPPNIPATPAITMIVERIGTAT